MLLCACVATRLVVSHQGSGYDCGMANDCIQPSGSGYYIASRAEVGGNSSNRYQAHNFHSMRPPRASPITPSLASFGYTTMFFWGMGFRRHLGGLSFESFAVNVNERGAAHARAATPMMFIGGSLPLH